MRKQHTGWHENLHTEIWSLSRMCLMNAIMVSVRRVYNCAFECVQLCIFGTCDMVLRIKTV